MRRLVFINSGLNSGGAERVMTLLANHFSETDDVTMILTRNKPHLYELNPKVHIIQLNNDHNKVVVFVKRIVDLRRIIRVEKPDVIISFMNDLNFFAAIANIGFRSRLIVSERTAPLRQDKRVQYFISRFFTYKIADSIVFQTDQARMCYSMNIRKKGTIIENPIDLSILPPVDRSSVKDKIVAVGRLVKLKRFDMLIEAFTQVVKEHRDLTLDIYGEGEEEDKLRGIVKRNHLEHHVNFKGFSTNVLNEIGDSLIYVSVSQFEGMSNSMMEAMALGIPSICTDCPVGGASLVIKNRENGILIPVDDENALICAINELIENRRLADRLSLNARNIREEYNIETISLKWDSLIKGLLKV